jgi:4-aminobutyrate aminotransferase-like enzyme
MGDVHPHVRKAELARELSRLTFQRWIKKVPDGVGKSSASMEKAQATGKTIFCNSGFEAVEAALKTALLATGKPGVIAFTGAYHGLGYGTLNATHRRLFHEPFQSQLAAFGHFVPFPEDNSRRDIALESVERGIRKLFAGQAIGAILVEPVQGRAGIRVPPPSFLPLLRQLASRYGALLICDEIYTGFGRTGRWFACEHSDTVPDVICLGKALTGGFPLSACVGKVALMDEAWPCSEGEAIHTSTFLGHPVGCAMALAQIAEIHRLDLVARSEKLGSFLLDLLRGLKAPPGNRLSVRGLGLMAGVELNSLRGSPATALTLRLIKSMLSAGYILLPEGEHSNVIGFTPPLTVPKQLLQRAVEELQEQLK